MKLAFVFPGQGSQSVGMLATYAAHPLVRATFDEACAVLGQDLWALVENGPTSAQPDRATRSRSMLAAAIAVWRAWLAAGGRGPRWSRDTASANTRRWSRQARSRSRCVAAGALSRAGDAGSGARGRRAMAAMLGSTMQVVAAACAEAAQGQSRRAGQLQRAEPGRDRGHAKRVERAIAAAKARGAKRALLLPVSAPFHSSLLKPRPSARRATRRHHGDGAGNPGAAQRRRHGAPDARWHSRGACATGGKPVRWAQTVEAFAARGITHVVECGPGKVLPDSTSVSSPTCRSSRCRTVRQSTRRSPRSEPRMADAQLAGQVALVTGATRGIGRAIALALHRDGAKVVGTATTDDGAASIATYLHEAGNAGTGLRLDVTDSAALDAVLTDIEARFGAVTVLVNNAGITRDNLLIRMKDDEWDAIMATNLRPAYRLAKAVLRGMMKARHGRIIQIGSVVGTSGNPGQANYAAAKAGARGVRQVARAGGRQPQHHGELRRAGFHRHRYDARIERGATRQAARAHSAGPPGHARGCGRRRGISRLAPGGLHHRRHAPRQRAALYMV
jgi:NADP-dependent 3-hydroxy acid dehydrogenase YdfG/malonyl CoA-acyl carrier protein transacylase